MIFILRSAFLLAIVSMSAVVSAEQAPSSSSCHITEQSIFADCVTETRGRSGTMRKEDLTVEGFAIGRATLDEVEQRFPGTRRFRLVKEEESPIGICVKNRRGYAVVFASGYAGGWKILDSIYIAPFRSLERQRVPCQLVPSLSRSLSTESGISPGIERERIRALLHDAIVQGSRFEVDYSTTPNKAPWVSPQITPTTGEDWIAISGAIGGFREGRLRWFVVYGAVSN